MILRPAITAITILLSNWMLAQNVILEPQEDPVQEAIRKFNQRETEKPNEVTVILDPSITPTTAPKEEAKTAPAESANPTEPVLVTGKPPKNAGLANQPETPPASPSEKETEASVPKPEQGLAVHVEKIQSGKGNLDPSQVKLLAPFPAKPLYAPPKGWRFESSENTPPFIREVELSPGKKITLKVRPHLLVPVSNTTDVFSVAEPGFDSALGYNQTTTVGAIISNSVKQLENDSNLLGETIDNLQQLLTSLPKPPEPPPAVPEAPKTSTPRKR
ncbi:MAG: hypothetical protein H8M99_01335 [Gloeobacteraceae cyanobacterium ES-bin-144]|nr:hypothetical protein [Verrucomicrobiales bacterium]